jgi:hypothetical protein
MAGRTRVQSRSRHAVHNSTPWASTNVPIACPVSSVSGHGQSEAASVGATISAVPSATITPPWRPSTSTAAECIGAVRGGSVPGTFTCRSRSAMVVGGKIA